MTLKWQKQNEILEQQNSNLTQRTSELYGQVQEMETQNNGLVLQAQEIIKQIEENEVKERAARNMSR